MTATNGTGKRVLLVESGQFIGGVIHNLLASLDSTQVIETFPASGRELIKNVEKYHPHIIILDDTLQAEFLQSLLRYMQHTRDALRVLVLNTNSNQVQIYEKQQLNVSQTADFFAFL